jgi:hypothetical protein
VRYIGAKIFDSPSTGHILSSISVLLLADPEGFI